MRISYFIIYIFLRNSGILRNLCHKSLEMLHAFIILTQLTELYIYSVQL